MITTRLSHLSESCSVEKQLRLQLDCRTLVSRVVWENNYDYN